MDELLNQLSEEQLIYVSKTVLVLLELEYFANEVDFVCSINTKDKKLAQQLAQHLKTLDRLGQSQFLIKVTSALEACISSYTQTLIVDLEAVT